MSLQTQVINYNKVMPNMQNAKNAVVLNIGLADLNLFQEMVAAGIDVLIAENKTSTSPKIDIEAAKAIAEEIFNL